MPVSVIKGGGYKHVVEYRKAAPLRTNQLIFEKILVFSPFALPPTAPLMELRRYGIETVISFFIILSIFIHTSTFQLGK